MMCANPVRLMFTGTSRKQQHARRDYPDGLLVPCGKCLQCRAKKSQEWALRMLHELESYDDAMFVTLTYSDDNLPECGSLRKRDLQLFFKRLRKALKKSYKNGASKYEYIRYFACGEYGSRTHRPHYHAIIYGLSPRNDNDCQMVVDNWRYADWSVRAIRNSGIGVCTVDSCRYVAKYVTKQLSGDAAYEVYNLTGREPVFRLVSLGLGRDFADLSKDDILKKGYITVNGVKQSIPRYYLKRFGVDRIMDLAEQDERERDQMYEHCGMYITDDEAYRQLPASVYDSISKSVNAHRLQSDRNIRAKCEMMERDIKPNQ